jgi:hypothetical protein
MTIPHETARRLAEVDARHLTCGHPPAQVSRLPALEGFGCLVCRHCNSYQVTRCDELPAAVTGLWEWDDACRQSEVAT